MHKRALVNLNPPDQEPYWAFVPTNLVDPRRKVKAPRVRTVRPKPKAFANPNSFGYGGGQTPWPFDIEKARHDGRYRAGIRNAINADWTASNWKSVARSLLLELLEIELKAMDNQ